MTKVTIDDNTKKTTIENMSGGDIFIDDNYYYMYIDLDTIIRLSDFIALDINDFPDEKKHIICDAEIIVHNVVLKL